MELEHSFSVPVDIATAWSVLRDIEQIAPCMPGATIDSVDGDDFSGRVKVKVGPMQITYKGDASFVEADEDAYRAVIDARGRESRGSGTANAKITAQLTRVGEETRVEVMTDLAVTGKPAQFGRGVMADVGEKLIGRFADCLATQLAGGAGQEAAASAAAESQESESDTLVAGTATQEQEAGATVAGDLSVGADEAGGEAPAATEGDGTPTDGTLRPGQPTEAEAPDGGDLEGAGVPASGSTTAPASGPLGAPAGPPSTPAPRLYDDEAIDLLDVAGAPVLRRLAPVAAGVVVLLLLWRWRRR